MPPLKNSNNSPFIMVVIWVLAAAVCIQAYLLLKKEGGQPASGGKVPAAVRKPQPMSKPYKKPQTTKPTSSKPVASAGRIAVVLDDWGYNKNHCKFLSDISIPIGVAILPNLQYSREVISCAAQAGKEPMLHLPFEPHSAKESFESDYNLTVNLTPSAAKAKVAKILNEMQGVVGVNNHTGSKGTESAPLVTAALTEIKRRGLFFVDSVTSDRSVCGQVANKLKMRIGRRDVFLDNRNETAYIERQFARAADIARKNGYALVIGHDRALTLQVLMDQAKKLESEGIEFITVREYIKRHDYFGN